MILILTAGFLSAQENYHWPTDASRLLTSAFGEHRPDRIHAGIDIKTWNRNGYKVFAVEDGYIVRLRTSPFGYGRVVYQKLNDGKIVVYAHLSGFAEKLDRYITSAQEKRQQYSVDMWLKPAEIPVKRGEVIAFTGFSGSKLPHLHFELRDAANRPLNPLAYGFLPEDKAPPVATKVSFTPIDHRSRVKGTARPIIVRTENISKGKYNLKEPVRVWGRIGLGVDGFDINGLYDNYYGIYSLSLKVRGEEVYSVTFDRFSYDENPLINLDREYRLLRQDKGKFYSLYLKRGNSLSFYGKHNTGDGILQFDKEESVPFEIVMKDFQDNTSVLTGIFDAVKPVNASFDPVVSDNYAEADTVKLPEREFNYSVEYLDKFMSISFSSESDLNELPTAMISTGKRITGIADVDAKNKRRFLSVIPNTMLDGGLVNVNLTGKSTEAEYHTTISVKLEHIPRAGKRIPLKNDSGMLIFSRGDLYDDFWFRHEVESPKDDKFDIVSDIIHLGPVEVPLKSYILLMLNLPENDPQPDKLGIFSRDDDGDWHFVGSEKDARRNALRTDIGSMETVAVLRDTVPPEIKRFSPGRNNVVKNRNQKITVWFDDLLSGISSERDIELLVDGKKVISEWVPAYDRVEYKPNKALSRGVHTVSFTVSDRMGNEQSVEWQFTVQ